MQPPLEPPYASLVSHDLLGFLSINCLARSGPLDRDPCFKCCLETTNSCQRFFVVGGGGFALFCFVLFFKETFLLQHECGVNNWNAWPFFFFLRKLSFYSMNAGSTLGMPGLFFIIIFIEV